MQTNAHSYWCEGEGEEEENVHQKTHAPQGEWVKQLKGGGVEQKKKKKKYIYIYIYRNINR